MDFFASARDASTAPRLLDVASGSGAVIECALEAFAGAALDAWSLDSSAAAIEGLRERFPAVTGLRCDAGSIPPEAGHFDLITSQFGIEYAGVGAIGGLPAALAPGGRIALLLHHGGGLIQAECAASLEAVKRVQSCRFVARARDMFDAGFAAVRGADRAPYDESAKRLAPAVQSLEDLMSELGQDVAAGTVARLYHDVARIHGRLPHYDPDEVLSWLERMEGELEAYGGRMASMLEAGLDAEEFERACASLTARGCILDTAGPFRASDRDEPFGWALIARDSNRTD
jgi:SAM-dependent methyltransferase